MAKPRTRAKLGTRQDSSLPAYDYAGVVELADTRRSGRRERKLVRVQISPPAYINNKNCNFSF